MLSIPAPDRSGLTRSTDVPLYWCEYGDAGADPILVLHGGPGAHHDYLLPQMLQLGRGRLLRFYDQRGGGRSRTDDRGPVTWQTHVRDLDRLVAELGEPRVVIGYSWGGLLAALLLIEAMAGRAGFMPRTLILIDPAPINRRARAIFEQEFNARQSGPVIQQMRDELARSGLRERDLEAYRQRTFELSVAGYFAR